MGPFSLAFVGGALLLIGAWESLTSSNPDKPSHPRRFSTVTLLASSALSLLLLLSSLLSLLSSNNHHDPLSSPIHLQSLPVFSLFLLFSLLSLLTSLPYPLLNFLLLLSFLLEFLLFYLHPTHPLSLEHRFFLLMLIPISICIFSTLLHLHSPHSPSPRLARGIGLLLQGTWLIQIGLSLFSDWIPHGCHLFLKSPANYTVTCGAHMDDHRAKAIAVLLFNCHLAFIVPVIAVVYSFVGGEKMNSSPKDYTRYSPLGADLQMANQPQFTLDSDEEDGAESKRESSGVVNTQGNGAAVDI